MKFVPTAIPDVLRIEPTLIGDERGFFMETWRAESFRARALPEAFVQDNHSRSARGILRGLHYQIRRPQGKLVRVVSGAVYDVAVDLRQSSPTFGRWVGEVLSAENRYQLWIPPGFAHGFLGLSQFSDFLYKCTDYYDPDSERSLAWNDPSIGIDWPALPGVEIKLSAKDRDAVNLAGAEIYP